MTRLAHTIAEVMLAALWVVISMLLFMLPWFLVKTAGLGLFLFAFAVLAVERAEWHTISRHGATNAEEESGCI